MAISVTTGDQEIAAAHVTLTPRLAEPRDVAVSVTVATMLKYRAEIGDWDLDFHLYEKICTGCGRRFLARGGTSYCSKACQMKMRQQRRRAEHHVEVRDRGLRCGEPFEAQRSTREYCLVRCRLAAHRG